MSHTLFQSPFGAMTLLRRPRRRREVLRAWDAADHYLLDGIAQQPPNKDTRILVVNDRFGALALGLQDYACDSWGDSVCSQLAATENAKLNQRPPPQYLPATELPSGPYGLILYRVPKSHSLMRYQLQYLAGFYRDGAKFLGAAMAKYIDQAVLAVFSEAIADAKPTLAWKKARLIELESGSAERSHQDDRVTSDFPDLQLVLSNRANVFSRGKLDRGSRLLIENLDQLDPKAASIADLGCGNGLLGIVAQRHWPKARLHFFDDSFMAIDSARQNFANTHPDVSACFQADDCLSTYQGDGFDLVLCNPPFHQDFELGDHIAQQMFRDAHRHLKPGGQLCVVGNRHLNYHVSLKKQFGNCRNLAADAKFVLLLAQR